MERAIFLVRDFFQWNAYQKAELSHTLRSVIETLLTLLLMDAPVTPAPFDWNMVAALATVALAVIGFLAALAAIRTLQAIERQTGVLQESISVARTSANAAEKSAGAAKKSADLLINIERAWVEVELSGGHGQKPHITWHTSTDAEATTVAIEFACTNAGKSPAWLTTKRIGMIVLTDLRDTPNEIPTLEHQTFAFLGPELLAAGTTSSHVGMVRCEGRIAEGHPGLIFGMVTYRDIFFEQQRTTTFGYWIDEHGKLDRLMFVYPAYNQHT